MIIEFTKRTGIRAQEILGRVRTRRLNDARHLYWLLLYRNGFCYSDIGRLAGRDHSTVISGIRRIRDLLETGDRLVGGMWEAVKDLDVSNYRNFR
jgi:chromosomal replication initiation ATPase DnaA